MKTLFLVLFSFATFASSAQNIADSVSSLNFSFDDSTGIKLAEMIFESTPDIQVFDKQMEVDRYEVQNLKASWLNNIQGSFNINDLSVKSNPNNPQSLFYPKYNLNVILPLGYFFTKSSQVKKAKAQYNETQTRKEIGKKDLREAIRRAYQNYQLAKYLLALQETVVQDEAILYSQMESKFKNNEIQLDVFTDASKRYNTELVKRVNLLSNLNMTKIELEGLLGMDLETALQKLAGKNK
jgi:outer membrane protein TolC